MLTRTGIIAACVVLGVGCATGQESERKVTVIVGAAHSHSLENPVVSVQGLVREIHQTIGVTARFSAIGLAELSFRDPIHGVVKVPRRYYENVDVIWPNSLQFAYQLDHDSKTVAGYSVYFETGEAQWLADLKCERDDKYPVNPLYASLKVYFDSASRTFAVERKDACGNPLPG